MPTKIRLQRHGKKGSPYFHIVVADSRAKRDGKFIERIGSYNPTTNPATIELDSDKALDWLTKGAQPSDTARAILSYRGVMYKKHLMRGVTKGAMSMEDAEAKYLAWINEKDQKIADKATKIKTDAASSASKQFAAESAVKEERAKKIMAKQSSLAGDAKAAAAEEVAETADEVVAEGVAPVAEETTTPVAEETAAPVEAAAQEEAPAEEPKAESTDETPVEGTDEAPKEA